MFFQMVFKTRLEVKKVKKLKSKGFKELLLSIRSLSMNEQKRSLERFVDQWKGLLEQNDDICVIGLKI